MKLQYRNILRIADILQPENNNHECYFSGFEAVDKETKDGKKVRTVRAMQTDKNNAKLFHNEDYVYAQAVEGFFARFEGIATIWETVPINVYAEGASDEVH